MTPRKVGGGSHTAVEPGERAPAAEPTHDASYDPRGRLAWEVAAQLASGMLANPSRGHASVKDAMALFDQFLNEMHAYATIADSAAMSDAADERRRAHGDYFRGGSGESETPADSASPRSASQRAPQIAKPTPVPTRPRPSSDYQAIPPNARYPYASGTSGADSDDESSSGEARRGAA